MRTIQIGLLGLGTVGSGVYEIIQRRQGEWKERYGFELILKKIHVKNPDKPRTVTIDQRILTTNPHEILHDPEIEVIIEVMGGEEPALQYAQTALAHGKYLITANKLMLALHGPELFQLAKEHHVEIGFEGSVGGGIPIIQPLRESLNTNVIHSVLGIINGTTNYILTAMSEREEGYFDVLAEAQGKGYAEADPSSDVDGWDAAYKLAVLTGVAFGLQLPTHLIPTEGISKITLMDFKMAKELGYAIKLVAKAERTEKGLRGRVHPTLLPKGHPLASVRGVNNALLVTGDAVGEVLFYGPGAGKMATGSAVTADLVRICRTITQTSSSIMSAPQERLPEFATSEIVSSNSSHFFVTIKSTTKPDATSITSILHQRNVSVETVIMKDDSNLYYLGIITDYTSENAIQQAITDLSNNPQYRQILYYYVEGKYPNA